MHFLIQNCTPFIFSQFLLKFMVKILLSTIECTSAKPGFTSCCCCYCCFSRVWLCVTRDGSPPGSAVPGILQARTLEWVAISFSNAGKWKVKVKLLSPVWLLATTRTAAYQAAPSRGFFQARVLEWVAIAFSSLPPQFSSFQSLSRVRLFATPWIAARQASLSITNSQSLLKLMSIELVMPSNHLTLCRPLLLCPQSLPASGLFQRVSSSDQVAKVLEFQLQHQSF